MTSMHHNESYLTLPELTIRNITHNNTLHEEALSTIETNAVFEAINTTQNILIIILNTLLLCFIVSRPLLRNKIPNQLFVHLQLIHISIGVLHLVSYYCNVSDYVVDNILLISMFISLLITTVDRLVALKFPLRLVS